MSARFLSRSKNPLDVQRGHPQNLTTRARDHRAVTENQAEASDAAGRKSMNIVAAFDHHMCTCTKEPADGRKVGDRVRYTWLVGVFTVYFMKDKGRRVRNK